MRAHRIVATLMALVMASGSGFAGLASAQPVAAVPPAPEGAPFTNDAVDAMPPRLSYLDGEVSFWRPGATDWAGAQLNTPLAPGDTLYTGQQGSLEIQIGQASFVRANAGTQIGLDNQDANFIQFHVTGGQAAIDLRQLAAGTTVEVDTPTAAFTIDRGGYYHVDVQQDATTFAAYRGGAATMTTAAGESGPIGANQQVVLTGAESAQPSLGAAPPLTAWDNWNYQRSAAVLQPASTRYVSPATYGTADLDRYGTWRTAEQYGSVWVPSGVPAGWQPYSTGRWIWDPRYGWTWLDDAPWGWAPYHHGRWVYTSNYWAWAPGPVVVRPVYSPALVVFLGGASISIGARPVAWAPLSWGEPVVPWWGRRGFAGVPSWGGWGGPRVVNNRVINNNTSVNVTNINVYRNVQDNRAVVGVPSDRFGHGRVQVQRLNQADVQQLRPVRGAPDVKPVAASVVPSTSAAVKPPSAMDRRQVVATRPPRDLTPTLRDHGLTEPRDAVKAPRIVPAPPRGPGRSDHRVAPAPPDVTKGGPRPEPRRDVQTSPAPPDVTKGGPRPEPRRDVQMPPLPDAPKGGPKPEPRRDVQTPPLPDAPKGGPKPEPRRDVQTPPLPDAPKGGPKPEPRRDVQTPPPPPDAPKGGPKPEPRRDVQAPPAPPDVPKGGPKPEPRRDVQAPPAPPDAPKGGPKPEPRRDVQAPPAPPDAPKGGPKAEPRRDVQTPPPPDVPKGGPKPEPRRDVQTPPPPPAPPAAKAPPPAPQPDQRRAVPPPAPQPPAAKAPKEAPQPPAAKAPKEAPQAEHRPPAPPPGAAIPAPPAGQTVRSAGPPPARPEHAAPAPRPDHPAPAEKPDKVGKGEDKKDR